MQKFFFSTRRPRFGLYLALPGLLSTLVAGCQAAPTGSAHPASVQVAAAAPDASPPIANLLKVNPGFEEPGGFSTGNGSNTFPGWEQQHYAYSGQGVRDGDAPEGQRFYHLERGGRIATLPTARAAVSPGVRYEFSFAARKPRDDKPNLWEGTLPSVFFFDAQGKLVREIKGNEIQMSGAFPWQTFQMHVVAPPRAATAGVQVHVTRGSWPNEDSHDFSFDNFKLRPVPEPADKVAFVIAPRLIEPGRSVRVVARVHAKAPRRLMLRLMNGKTTVAETTRQVAAGRGRLELQVAVPAKAAKSDNYRWEARLLASNGRWDAPLHQSTQSGAFLDETVQPKPSGEVPANDPLLLYAGRWNHDDAKNPRCFWPGSQVRARFSGTSVKAVLSGNSEFWAIVDGDEKNLIKIAASGDKKAVLIAEKLKPGTHTLVLHKESEVGNNVTFHGLQVDAGSGLLRPEPLPLRRIEFYGDSITAGGSPDPKVPNPDPNNDGDYSGNQFRTFAAITARELGMEGRYIAKGGTGVSGSWVLPYTLLDYYDLQDFDGWKTGEGRKWNFSQWRADIVVIAIGHNDMFRRPSEQAFIEAYQKLVKNIRSHYPDAHIFCTNTTMSGPGEQWKKAVVPLLASDSKLHFRLFDPGQGFGAHPHAAEHRAMALGNEKWLGLVEWIEEELS